MNRRELLKLIAAATGTAMIGSTALMSGCATAPETPLSFSAEDIARLDEIAESILPRTDPPGAKDAKVGQFMSVYVPDCYTPEEQKIFYAGLLKINEDTRKTYGRSFIDRKSTRLNSSHVKISYAVFCFKKKKNNC